MSHLILTVIAIALMSALSVATLNYLPGDRQVVEESRQKMVKADEIFRDIVNRYAIAEGGLPTSLAQVIPTYGFTPPPLKNTSWSLGKDRYSVSPESWGTWVCLEGEFTPAQQKGISKALNNISHDAVRLSENCGETPTGVQPETYSAITLWVLLDTHLETTP